MKKTIELWVEGSFLYSCPPIWKWRRLKSRPFNFKIEYTEVEKGKKAPKIEIKDVCDIIIKNIYSGYTTTKELKK